MSIYIVVFDSVRDGNAVPLFFVFAYLVHRNGVHMKWNHDYELFICLLNGRRTVIFLMRLLLYITGFVKRFRPLVTGIYLLLLLTDIYLVHLVICKCFYEVKNKNYRHSV